jgi:HAD superfamily hydrolase (TIGR01509 family)
VKTAIFDFDGTLFESASYWEKVINQYLMERKIIPPQNILSIVKPLGIKDTAAMFKEKFSLEERQEDIAANWRTQMGKNYHDVIPVKEYAYPYIQQLRSEGVSICLATAMERDFVMPAMERTCLTPLFDLIVTIADVKANKNSPRIFEYCAGQFHAPFSECTVFEDSVQAATICKKAGFKVIGVFDGVGTNDCELMKPVCDQFIFSFKELIEQKILNL